MDTRSKTRNAAKSLRSGAHLTVGSGTSPSASSGRPANAPNAKRKPKATAKRKAKNKRVTSRTKVVITNLSHPPSPVAGLSPSVAALERISTPSEELHEAASSNGHTSEQAHLDKSKRALQLRIAHLQTELRGRDGQLDDAKKTIARLERWLGIAGGDLTSLREWSSYDTEDVQHLLDLFDKINYTIREAAHHLAATLPLPPGRVIDSRDITRLLCIPERSCDARRSAVNALGPYLEFCQRTSVELETAVQDMTMAVLHRNLRVFVFEGFAPALFCTEFDELFTKMQMHVKEQEAQLTSGRWRMITYRCLQAVTDADAGTEADHFTAAVVDSMVRIVQPWLTSSPSDEPRISAAMSALGMESMEIYRSATKWHDKACGAHCAYDYATFVVEPGSAYSEQDFERGTDEPERAGLSMPVVLPVAMGLKASRKEQVLVGHTRATDCVVLRKAVVI